MSKYAGKLSSRYAGTGGATILSHVIIGSVLAGGVGVIWLLS